MHDMRRPRRKYKPMERQSPRKQSWKEPQDTTELGASHLHLSPDYALTLLAAATGRIQRNILSNQLIRIALPKPSTAT